MLEESMSPSATMLWRLNSEYRRRLTKASRSLNLLEQLLTTRQGDSETLQIVRAVHMQISKLVDDHRNWRYNYFYATPESRRMVQHERDIHRAIAWFSRMRGKHERTVSDAFALLLPLDAPAMDDTNVENGDLWMMMCTAMDELGAFIQQPESHL